VAAAEAQLLKLEARQEGVKAKRRAAEAALEGVQLSTAAGEADLDALRRELAAAEAKVWGLLYIMGAKFPLLLRFRLHDRILQLWGRECLAGGMLLSGRIA
jgi:hypothetical protein